MDTVTVRGCFSVSDVISKISSGNLLHELNDRNYSGNPEFKDDNIVIDVDVDAVDVVDDAESSTLTDELNSRGELFDIKDLSNKELLDELSSRGVNLAPEPNMPISKLKQLLCDRYCISHLSTNETVLKLLKDEL